MALTTGLPKLIAAHNQPIINTLVVGTNQRYKHNQLGAQLGFKQAPTPG